MTVGIPVKIVLFFFAIIFHEFFHGWIAYLLGDDTAKKYGRVTLNPLPHIDPIGTILIPLVSFFAGGFIVGWAKPVPFDPHKLINPKMGTAIIGAAGPGGNILLAIISSS